MKKPANEDHAASRAARDQGMARAEENADQAWKDAVMDAIVELAAMGRSFLSDDVRRMVGDPPDGTSPNAMGALFSSAAKKGLIRVTGYVKSARVIGHSNLVRQWTGNDGPVGGSR